MAPSSQGGRRQFAPCCRFGELKRGLPAAILSPYREIRALILLVVALGTTFAVEVLGRLFWDGPASTSGPPVSAVKTLPVREDKKGMKAKSNDVSNESKRIEDFAADPLLSPETPFAESTSKPGAPN